MDITPKQFNSLLDELKKIRKHLEELHNDLNEQIRTIGTAQQRYEDNRNVEPIWVEPVLAKYEQTKREKETDGEKQYSVQNSLRWATWFAFGAAVLYAAITLGLWKTARITLKDNRIATAKQFEKMDKSIAKLKEANDIAIAANRPWLGVIPAVEANDGISISKKMDRIGPFIDFVYTWHIKNAGHRPARIERVLTTGEFYPKRCGMNPDFNNTPPDIARDPFANKRTSKGLLLPEMDTRSPFKWPFRPTE